MKSKGHLSCLLEGSICVWALQALLEETGSGLPSEFSEFLEPFPLQFVIVTEIWDIAETS